MKLKFLDKVLVKQGFYAGNFGTLLEFFLDDNGQPAYRVEFAVPNDKWVTAIILESDADAFLELLDTRAADTTAKVEAEKALEVPVEPVVEEIIP